LGDFNGKTEIDGLRELRRELRRYSREAPREIQKANKSVAETVSAKALGKMRALGGVHAHVARMKSIRPRAGQAWAGITIGGRAAKHGPALGAEFGALQYPQFPSWRGNQEGAGYAVWPTIREEQDRIRETYVDVLQDALNRIDTRG